MNRNQRKTARERGHVEMMKAFHVFMTDEFPDGLHRPLEGELRYNDMLLAFKAGWESA